MKKKLLKWIERILGIDELKKELEKERELMQKYRNETGFWFENRKEELRHTQDLVKLLKEARIASDVAFDCHRSWAIVCLGGKKELVHFYQFCMFLYFHCLCFHMSNYILNLQKYYYCFLVFNLKHNHIRLINHLVFLLKILILGYNLLNRILYVVYYMLRIDVLLLL